MPVLRLFALSLTEFLIKLFFEKTYNYFDILVLWYVFIEKAWGWTDWQMYASLIFGFLVSSALSDTFKSRF